jgi:hypothetical protein
MAFQPQGESTILQNGPHRTGAAPRKLIR